MAKLKYDKKGRLLFTKDMKKEYTILIPMMLPYHFTLIKKLLDRQGYRTVLLTSTGTSIVDEGLQNVHNDTCYPALLVIGQLLDAIKSGNYDQDKVAVIISQTGGGCRASNYLFLLRKALKKNGLEKIPVISFGVSGLEKNPGFKLTPLLMMKMACALIYADLITDLANQSRPYENIKGSVEAVAHACMEFIIKHSMHLLHIGKTIDFIVKKFAEIPMTRSEKVKVGVVGEIYIKYAPLGNNNLEAFLQGENCEVVVPGVMDFILYNCESALADYTILGINKCKAKIYKFAKRLIIRLQNRMIRAIRQYSEFRPPSKFEHIKSLVKGYLSTENKMGEGWLLTGEMLDLIESGVNNIVCTQPFGCLPNHIAGKGMIREIRKNNEKANIVAIDYDPSATKINQENRIKLMLALAREQLEMDSEDRGERLKEKNNVQGEIEKAV